jgi:hypothetical protein
MEATMKGDAPELDALFEVARYGDEPSDADRRRVTARVAERLAVGAGAGAAVFTLSRFAWAASFKTWGILAVVVVGAGSGAYLLSGPNADEHRGLTAPPVAHSVAPARVVAVPAPPVTEVEREPTLPRTQPRHERPSLSGSAEPSATPEPSRLARETAALRDANEALRSGAAARALGLLDDFAKQFPNGMLAEEALATRISTLCKLGRVADARALGARFMQRYPRSPALGRVRGSCALSKE